MPILPTFSDGSEPREFIYSHRAQTIANRLPDHINFRQDRESVGQKFLAPIGKELEELHLASDETFTSSFASFVDPDEPDYIVRVDLDPAADIESPTVLKNYTKNSSFEIWSNHAGLPDFWRATGSGTVRARNGFLGNRAMAVLPDPSDGNQVELYNEFEVNIKSGEKWSYSLWYEFNDSASLTLPGGYTGFRFQVTGYGDGFTETLSTNFSLTAATSPSRLSISDSFSTGDVTKVRLSVVVKYTASTFEIVDPVVVDLVQAENSEFPTDWVPHLEDKWPHVTSESENAPVLIEHNNRVQFVDRQEEFWQQALPTRVSLVKVLTGLGTIDTVPSADADGVIEYASSGLFNAIEFDGTVWEGTWAAIQNTSSQYRIRQRGTGPLDVYADYALAPRTWKQWFNTDSNIVVESITSLHDKLWVVCQNTNANGETKRYIAITTKDVPIPYPSYLEVPVMLELPEQTVGTLITQVYFENNDQQHLFVGNGESLWIYRLYYDYYMLDRSTNSIYMREKYDERLHPILSVPRNPNANPDEIKKRLTHG